MESQATVKRDRLLYEDEIRSVEGLESQGAAPKEPPRQQRLSDARIYGSGYRRSETDRRVRVKLSSTSGSHGGLIVSQRVSPSRR